MTYKNPELAKHLQPLFGYADETLYRLIHSGNDDYNRCIEIMRDTPEISDRLNSVLGIESVGRAIGNASDAINVFLRSCILNQKTFEQSYKAFENSFYDDTAIVTYTVRLYNFEKMQKSDREPIKLADDIHIIYQPSDDPYSDALNNSSYVIQMTEICPIVVTYNSDEPRIRDTKRINALNIAQKIIHILRLIHIGDVYIDDHIHQKIETFDWLGLRSVSPLNTRTNIGIRRLYSITKPMESQLKDLFENYAELGERFNLAVSRFSLGIENPKQEFALLDYMIAIECLYLPTDHNELRFKAGLRVALLLYDDFEQRKNVSKIVKSCYDHRSKVAHGETIKDSKIDTMRPLVKELKDILRKSLLLFIQDSSRFTRDAFAELELGKK